MCTYGRIKWIVLSSLVFYPIPDNTLASPSRAHPHRASYRQFLLVAPEKVVWMKWVWLRAKWQSILVMFLYMFIYEFCQRFLYRPWGIKSDLWPIQKENIYILEIITAPHHIHLSIKDGWSNGFDIYIRISQWLNASNVIDACPWPYRRYSYIENLPASRSISKYW